ncbi:B3 domain-containing protein Os12g0591400 [Euphorbia peplus]|nr:B3 domain-containing protein Os12g0591400 [Euphorbia peplus]
MASKLEACVECKRKCILCHLKKRSPTPLVSSFFKVMITDRFSQVLYLPPKFAPVVSSLIGQEVPLEDSSGLQWKVKVTTMEDSLVLKPGWDVFVQAHGLDKGDFVIFHYVIGSHFVVQIFDKTGCEKLDFSKNKSQNKKAKTNRNSAQCGKGSTVKQEPKSSVFSQSSMETRQQRETKIVKMATNGSSGDQMGFTRSKPVPKAEIFEDPCFFINRESKCKINDPVNIKMAISSDQKRVSRSQAVPKVRTCEDFCSYMQREKECKINDPVNVEMSIDSDSGDKDSRLRSRSVPKARVFDKELDSKDTEYQTANLDTSRTYNLDTHGSNQIIGSRHTSRNVDKSHYLKNQAASDHKVSQKVAPVEVSKFDKSVFGRYQADEGKENSINTGKKPKVKMEQDNPFLSPPVGCKVKVRRKVKVEPNDNKDSFPNAGSITCLIEAIQDFLELPAALPSTYKAKFRGSSENLVFLKGPTMGLWPVFYHETPKLKILRGGWKAFCQCNKIRPGDECTFLIENEDEDIFRVTVAILL